MNAGDYVAKWLLAMEKRGAGLQALAYLQKQHVSPEDLPSGAGGIYQWMLDHSGAFNVYSVERSSKKHLIPYIATLGITALDKVTDNDLENCLQALKFERLAHLVQEAGQSATSTLELSRMLSEIQRQIAASGDSGVKTAREAGEELVQEIEHWQAGDTTRTVIKTGIASLDNIVVGMWREEVTAILGGTGSGKSALANNIAMNVSSEGKRVLYVTLEMGAKYQAMRATSNELSIDSNRLLFKRASSEQYETFKQAALQLPDSLFFLDVPSTDLYRIQSEMLILEDVDLVIIDFGRLLKGGEMSESEAKRAWNIAYNLKELARTHTNPNGTKAAILVIWDAPKEVFRRPDFIIQKEDCAWGGEFAFAAVWGLMDVYAGQYESSIHHKTCISLLARLGYADIFERIPQADGKTKYKPRYRGDLLVGENGEPIFTPASRIIHIAKSRFGSTKLLEMNYVGEFTRWEEVG